MDRWASQRRLAYWGWAGLLLGTALSLTPGVVWLIGALLGSFNYVYIVRRLSGVAATSIESVVVDDRASLAVRFVHGLFHWFFFAVWVGCLFAEQESLLKLG